MVSQKIGTPLGNGLPGPCLGAAGQGYVWRFGAGVFKHWQWEKPWRAFTAVPRYVSSKGEKVLSVRLTLRR